MRSKVKHLFKVNDEVAITHIRDTADSDDYCGTFPIKDYSYRGYGGYKSGDEKYQEEIGIIISININEITVQITEEDFVIVPYFCIVHLDLLG